MRKAPSCFLKILMLRAQTLAVMGFDKEAPLSVEDAALQARRKKQRLSASKSTEGIWSFRDSLTQGEHWQTLSDLSRLPQRGKNASSNTTQSRPTLAQLTCSLPPCKLSLQPHCCLHPGCPRFLAICILRDFLKYF